MNSDRNFLSCVTCAHLGNDCNGPNFLAMSPETFCRWVNLRKKYKGWSVEYIAEKSGVSESSLKRILSGNAYDVRLSTLQAIIKVLVGDSWGDAPCILSESHSDSAHLKEAVAREKEAVSTLKEYVSAKDKRLDERMAFIHIKDAEIDELKKERKFYRFLTILVSFLLFSCLIYIIVTLILDYRSPLRGFWWV